jgi:hypothetical protein
VAPPGRGGADPLRNVELTAPYLHDGRFKSLDEVVEHYSTGIKRHPNLGRRPFRHPRSKIGGGRLPGGDTMLI